MGHFDVPGSAPNGAHGAPLFNSVGFQKISLSCGKMKLDQSAVAPMLEAIEKYFPATERITRGRVAFLLNSLAEENGAHSAYYDEPFKDISLPPPIP